MKVLILVSCALAVASAGYSPFAYSFYPQHLPVIANGVPVETPEVQAAKINHFAAHAEANARSGLYSYAAPFAHVYGVPAITHNALPLDTPEVAAAKAQHFADYAVAAQRNGVAVAAPIAQISGHPVDTPEVQHAKAAHFAAHAAARSGIHLRKRRGIYAYGQHIPVIDHNGVPVETPEVQAAKANHFAAHVEASARSVGVAPGVVVPAETPEVQAAKINHFAAHAEALSRSGHYSPLVYAAPWAYAPYGHAAIGPDGHPVETPEVQLAKAAHFAAHAAAGGHYY